MARSERGLRAMSDHPILQGGIADRNWWSVYEAEFAEANRLLQATRDPNDWRGWALLGVAIDPYGVRTYVLGMYDKGHGDAPISVGGAPEEAHGDDSSEEATDA